MSEREACGAKTRAGHPCKNPPVTGRTRCRMHGGKSKRGIEHPNFQGKGTGKPIMPDRLADSYDRWLSDPQLLDLRHQLAVMGARADDLLRAAADGDSPAAWAEVAEAYDAFRTASGKDDPTGATDALRRLDAAIESGQAGVAAWKEHRETVKVIRHLFDSQRKHEKDLAAMIPYDRVAALVATLLHVVMDEEDDERVRARIVTRFRAEFYRGVADR